MCIYIYIFPSNASVYSEATIYRQLIFVQFSDPFLYVIPTTMDLSNVKFVGWNSKEPYRRHIRYF